MTTDLDESKTKITCPTCFELNSTDALILMDCSCSFCPQCLLSWILSKIEEPFYKIDGLIPCMTVQCKTCFSIQNIVSQLPQESVNLINDKLFKVYLNQTSDIRRCPSSNCNYAGIIQATSACKEGIICELCCTQWREKIQDSKQDEVCYFFRLINHWKNEPFSMLRKKFITKRCPECKVLIEKNQGCDHMTCSVCKHEFCWICKAKHPSHNEFIHMLISKIKPLFMILTVVIPIVWMLITLYQFPFVQELTSCTVFPLFTFLKNGGIWIYEILRNFSVLFFLMFWQPYVGCIIVIVLWGLWHTKINFKIALSSLAILVICGIITYFFSNFKDMGLIVVVESLVAHFVKKLFDKYC